MQLSFVLLLQPRKTKKKLGIVRFPENVCTSVNLAGIKHPPKGKKLLFWGGQKKSSLAAFQKLTRYTFVKSVIKEKFKHFRHFMVLQEVMFCSLKVGASRIYATRPARLHAL